MICTGCLNGILLLSIQPYHTLHGGYLCYLQMASTFRDLKEGKLLIYIVLSCVYLLFTTQLNIYRTPGLIWCCHVSTFYTLLQFQSFLHLYPIIQISFLQNIPHFTIKHDNYNSYMLSTLLESFYLAMILSLCIAKLVFL